MRWKNVRFPALSVAAFGLLLFLPWNTSPAFAEASDGGFSSSGAGSEIEEREALVFLPDQEDPSSQPKQNPVALIRKQSSHSPPLCPGSEILYNVILTNISDLTLEAAFEDPIPANTTYVGGSVTGGGVLDPASNSILWAGTLKPGESVQVSFRVTVNQGVPDDTLVLNDVTGLFVAPGVGTGQGRVLLPLIVACAQKTHFENYGSPFYKQPPNCPPYYRDTNGNPPTLDNIPVAGQRLTGWWMGHDDRHIEDAETGMRHWLDVDIWCIKAAIPFFRLSATRSWMNETIEREDSIAPGAT